MTGRRAHAHNATARIDADTDPAAIGAAITVALCGHWEHDGPCPIAPHHTSWHHDPNQAAIVHIRTLYAVTDDAHDDASPACADGLALGTLTGTDGHTTRWHLLDDSPAQSPATKPTRRAPRRRLTLGSNVNFMRNGSHEIHVRSPGGRWRIAGEMPA